MPPKKENKKESSNELPFWKRAGEGIFITAVGFLIGGILLSIIQDAMTMPKPIPIVQSGDSFCQNNIAFIPNEDTSPFSVNFRNLGADGTIFAQISSESNKIWSKVDIRSNYYKNFTSNSTRSWIIKNTEYIAFSYLIKRDENLKKIDSFKIFVDYQASKEVLWLRLYTPLTKRCCTYQLSNNGAPYQYELVDESC